MALCPECERKGLDHDEVVQRCRSSIFWVAWYLCGYRDLSMVLHWGMCKWLQQGLAMGHQRHLCLAPRGHFKTSLLTVAFIVWFLIKNPDHLILLVIHSQKMALQKADEIMGIFESQTMAHFFPDLAVSRENKKALQWTRGQFTIPRAVNRGTPSVTCMGITSGQESWHGDLIVWDDVVDAEASDSMEQMEAAIRKARRVNPLFKERDKSLWVVWGTLWEGGLYEGLMRRRAFRKMVLGAYADDRFFRWVDGLQDPAIKSTMTDPEYIETRVKPENRGVGEGDYIVHTPWEPGSPIFPERECLESLEAAREEMGLDFSPQMLNLGTKDEDKSFKEEHFKFYDMSGPPGHHVIHVDDNKFPVNFLYRSLTIDPTGGLTRRCDVAAISVCGWHRGHRVAFLLDRWVGREDPKKQIEIVLAMAEKWRVHVIAPEANAYQNTFAFWMRQMMKDQNIHYRIDPYQPGVLSKGRRILGFQPYCANGQFYILPTHADVIRHMVGLRIVENQVMGESPGLADSLTMHRKYWKSDFKKRAPNDPFAIPEEDPREESKLRRPVRYGLTAEVC